MNLWGVEIRLLPATKAFLDLGNGLQPLCWSLGKVIKLIIAGVSTAETGADGLEDPARDLRAGGGASYCLKLDISEENIGRQG